MTGSFSKSRNGSRYPYYHCNHSGYQCINAEDANQKFVQLLNSFVPDENVLELFGLVIADLNQVAKYDISKQIKQLDDEVVNLKVKVDEADDMLISKEIEKESHKRIVTRHCQCIDELTEKQKFLKESDMSAIQEKINYTKNILVKLGDYFQKSDSETKIKLIGSIITSKIQFLENSYRTSGIDEVLTKIGLISNELQGAEKEKAT